MSSERDQLGRFVRGNRGGPGRPKGTRNPAYQLVLEEVVSLDEWRQILERVKSNALYGNEDAIKFLAPYLLGRPSPGAPLEREADDVHSLGPALAPSQLSSAMIKLLDQEIIRAKRSADEAAEDLANRSQAPKNPH